MWRKKMNRLIAATVTCLVILVGCTSYFLLYRPFAIVRSLNGEFRRIPVQFALGRKTISIDLPFPGNVRALVVRKEPTALQLAELLSAFHALDRLDFIGCALSADSLDSLPLHECVSVVSMKHCSVAKATLVPMWRSSTIQIVYLEASDVGDREIEAIPLDCGVTNLSLQSTFVSNHACSRLRQLPKLEYLNLSFTDIDDEGIDAILELPLLRGLHVAGTRMSADRTLLLLKRKGLTSLSFNRSLLANSDVRQAVRDTKVELLLDESGTPLRLLAAESSNSNSGNLDTKQE